MCIYVCIGVLQSDFSIGKLRLRYVKMPRDLLSEFREVNKAEILKLSVIFKSTQSFMMIWMC